MLGHPVRQLIRVRIGPLKLGNMKTGEWRHLTASEIADLKQISNPQSQIPKAKPIRDPRHTARENRNPRTPRGIKNAKSRGGRR
jgi:hypothetical protein